jgi:xanthine dehydrogenase molybdopterin-binding subunit B
VPYALALDTLRNCIAVSVPSERAPAPTRNWMPIGSTNTVPSGALRGYGMTQPTFAVESVMHELAVALVTDLLELRRRNIIRPGDPLVVVHDEPDDVAFTEHGLAQCIDSVDAALRAPLRPCGMESAFNRSIRVRSPRSWCLTTRARKYGQAGG